MLKLVPFNDEWVSSHRLDIKAIYRRPHLVQNEFDEWVQATGPDGLPVWDLTTPQRVLNHNKLRSKGFEYVTLATRDDLVKAWRAGTIQGDWRQYDQHSQGGPWHHRLYFAGQAEADKDQLSQLRDQVSQFGPDAVEAIRRAVDPTFVLPAHLRAVDPPRAQSVSEGQPVEGSTVVKERRKPGPKPKVAVETPVGGAAA